MRTLFAFVILLAQTNLCFGQLQQLSQVIINKGSITDFDYQNDGKYLITASSKFIEVWHNGSNDLVSSFDSQHKEITAMAVAAKAPLVVTGGNDNLLHIFSLDTKEKTATLLGHSDEIISVDISPNGKYAAATSKDHRFIVWETESAKPILNEQIDKGYYLDVEFSPDNNLVATGNSLGHVIVWNVNETKKVFDGKIHNDWVRAVTFNSGSNILFSAGDDGAIKKIDLSTSSTTQSGINTLKSKVYCLDVSPDDQYLAIGTSAKKIIIQNLQTGAQIYNNKNSEAGTTTRVLFDPSGKYIVSIGYGSKSARMWDAGNLNIVPSFRLKDENDKTAPMIYVSNPPNLTENYVRYSEPIIELKGLVMDESGVNKLIVNGIKTPMRENGNFVINMPLVMGDNFVTIEAHDVNDNIALKKFIINRRDLDGTAYDARKAKNYLLVVGINDYDNWPKLYNAVSDANEVVNTLLTGYQFEFANTTVLTDKNATKENIYNTMRGLIEKITPSDNLVIYYSGHGYFDELMNEGYWVPVDANKGSQSEYLSNSSLLKIISNINSQHTFLVADACFSGSLFNETNRGYAENVEKYRSRWGLVSGRLEVVSDGATGENSPFAKHFIGYLKDNVEEKFTVSELVQFVKIEVANESDQTPLGNPIKSAGDEGGEFIFYKRK